MKDLLFFVSKPTVGQLAVLKISFNIEKKSLKATRTKLIIFNVNKKMKAFAILNLILNAEDSLDYPERKLVWCLHIFRDVEGLFWKG